MQLFVSRALAHHATEVVKIYGIDKKKVGTKEKRSNITLSNISSVVGIEFSALLSIRNGYVSFDCYICKGCIDY